MRPKKVLIAGQGITGSVLALTMHRAGLDITLADDGSFVSATANAAGVINPVTGKRYVKSWMFDAFYPFAQQFYTSLEAEAGAQIWFDYPIVRLLGSTIEQNEWNLRSGRPEYQGFTDATPDAGDWQGLVQNGYAYGHIQRSGRVDFSAIQRFTRQFFEEKGRWINAKIKPVNAPELLNQFDLIVFCEGHQAANNPFFPEIPWLSAKGDRLLIRLETDQPIQSMLKKKVAIVPLGDVFWVGANYYWDFEDSAPTPEGLAFNTSELDSMLSVGYQVVDHSAAIRPVVKDRRPVLGWSNKLPGIGIFNGMGSKGALMTPFWAEHFTRHILENTPINPDVHLNRFTPK